ncbi:hypothetical protein BKA80DRAFT_298681 [Phyllosticta citrichinensis]
MKTWGRQERARLQNKTALNTQLDTADYTATNDGQNLAQNPANWQPSAANQASRRLYPDTSVVASLTVISGIRTKKYSGAAVEHDCAPELVLAIAAVGAQHRFENHNGLLLFDAARSIALEQRRRRMRKFADAPHEPARPVGPAHKSRPRFRDLDYSPESRHQRMQTVCALLLVTAFATREDHPETIREATELQSSLSRCPRELSLRDEPSSIDEAGKDWHEWAHVEMDRRTKLIAFCFLTIHTVTHNLPPIILGNEIQLRLPCSSQKWNAASATEWMALSSSASDPEPIFQEAFNIRAEPVLERHFNDGSLGGKNLQSRVLTLKIPIGRFRSRRLASSLWPTSAWSLTSAPTENCTVMTPPELLGPWRVLRGCIEGTWSSPHYSTRLML